MKKKDFNICTIVQGKTLQAFVKNIKKAQESATMIELRADSITDLSIDDLPIIMGPVKVPCIFTCRHNNEGGLFMGPQAKQKEILEKAFDLGFTYVDVAYDNLLIYELSAKEKKQLLISYHCDEGTPDFVELMKLLEFMRSINPAMMKIATMVIDYDDIPILAAILKKAKKNEKLTVIGLGKRGKITRLMFPPAGSYIAFVTMKGEKNIAPGMLTEKDLKPILKHFNK
ncbi:MAG TPA: type I 3-dehydroquinate dehydratase [Bacteroidia bacterium]|nr:type I 3-dehydroquinate dehydratase [Bacteroidia bacterium]